MATVRLTYELRGDIIRRAESMFNAKINAAQQAVPPDLGDRVYEKLVGRYTDKLNELPASFLRCASHIDVSKYGSSTLPLSRHAMSTSRPIPYSFQAYENDVQTGLINPQGSYNYMELVETGLWGDLDTEIKAWVGKYEDAVNEKTAFIGPLKLLLGSHNVLKPVLEACPSIMELLSADVKERHAAKADKRGKTAVVISEETVQALAGPLARLKITGSV